MTHRADTAPELPAACPRDEVVDPRAIGHGVEGARERAPRRSPWRTQPAATSAVARGGSDGVRAGDSGGARDGGSGGVCGRDRGGARGGGSVRAGGRGGARDGGGDGVRGGGSGGSGGGSSGTRGAGSVGVRDGGSGGARGAFAVAWLLAAVLAAPAAAQEPGTERVVIVTVTAAGDQSVWFDHGRDIGLAPGTFVRLQPPGAGVVEVEVRAVTQTSARADVPPGVPLPPVGTRGEARVPVAAERTTAQPGTGDRGGAAPRRDVPEHPPWVRQEAARDTDQPLLVPTFGQRPDERPATFGGRTFASLQYGVDREGNRDSEYWLGRLGARADATNVLGHGERWQAAGELDARHVGLAGREDEDDLTGRLDLLSVQLGTEAWAPTGLELGRFWSRHLPELGLVDGVEVVRRFRGGLQIGAGAGAYPRPFPARETGDDVGVHAFAAWTLDERRTAAATLGLQKTWHRGASDRDLVLARAEWRPADGLWLLANTKLDVYSGADDVKGSGVELTEGWLQARWDGRIAGGGATVTRFTWPELRRSEYTALPLELVRDGFVDRVSLFGSWRPAPAFSLRGNADLWRDQDDSGETFGVDADWRGLWREHTALSVHTFVNDGGYAAGPGVRVQLRDRIGELGWRAGVRWYRYELDGPAVAAPGGDGNVATWTRQSVELGLSCPLGDRGDLDLSAERWFGDREDATHFGLYLQWRF